MNLVVKQNACPQAPLAQTRWAGLVSWASAPEALAVLVVVLTAGTAAEMLVRYGSVNHAAPIVMLATLATACLAAVRRFPWPAVLVMAAASVGLLAQGFSTDPVTRALTGTLPIALVLALALATYLVARSGPTWCAAIVVVPFAVLATWQPWTDDLVGRLGLVSLMTVTGLGAITGAGRRHRAQMVRLEATEQALTGTLRENVERAERARIARELHDVVAHHLSVVSIQAETTRLTIPDMPAQGARQLEAIGETARTALTEMRRLLGVLRDDAGAAQVGELAPQPTLGQITALIDQTREASTAPVLLVVKGAVEPLDPGIELTAYRIAQEALTNARRHAPGAAVEVELEYLPEALTLRVRDNGPGAGDAPPGHGLLGMRERAAMIGGSVEVGPAPSGGFKVTAVLPRTMVT